MTTKFKFDQKVLDSLPPLASGKHKDIDEKVCAMEALARACGLGTTDRPECASNIIGAYCRELNDNLLNDERRDRLIRPLLPLMVGTVDDGYDQERIWVLADHAVRGFAADAMEIVGLNHEAKILRALTPVRDIMSAESASAAAKMTAKSAMWWAESASAAARMAAWSATSASAAAQAAWSAQAARMAARSAWSVRSAAAKEESQWQKAADVLREICEIGK